MRSVTSRLGAGVLLAVLAIATAPAAPANGASATAAGAAAQATATHRPIGGQATSAGSKVSKAISENGCLDQGGKVIRNLSCSGTHKMCETVSDGGKTLTVECVDAE